MMDSENILLTMNAPFAIWCAAGQDATELARAAGMAIDNNVGAVSVAPGDVMTIWPWIENKHIQILPRFYLAQTDIDSVSDLTQEINTALKSGADGAIVFVGADQLSELVNQVYLIRDDLFFNKSAFIGLNVGTVGPFEWDCIFAALEKLRADGLVLALTNDTGDASDFVGRVYAALSAWNNSNMNLYFVLGTNRTRIEQAMRLVQSMRPELVDKIKFFVNI